MAYNRWLTAAPPPTQEDLLHYGVVGMKWGVRKALYYKSKADKLGLSTDSANKKLAYLTKYNAAVKSFKSKSRGSLDKFDAKYRKYQDAANTYRLKADKKLNKFFKDYTGAQKATKKFEKYQHRANRISAKEQRLYKEMIKSYSKLKLEPDSDLRAKGEEIVRRSDIMSMTVYANGTGSKGKKMKHDIGFDVVSSYLAYEVAEGFDVVHHQVKGAKWGVKNGPPYPLSRQDRFSKDGKHVDKETYQRIQAKASGSGGHANPSTYKKTKSEVKSEKKAVRKANPNGTPQDQAEKNSLMARFKRAQREKEAQKKQQQAAEEESKAKQKAAIDRLMKSDLPDDEKQKILGRLSNADYIDNAIKSYHDKQNAAKAAQAAEREAVKRHGTAEEVMKFRETFTTEEWRDIANRLEAEERVKKFLNKPVEKLPKMDDQNVISKEVSSSDKAMMRNLASGDKKIFLSGDARTVYTNKTKFSPEQLKAISRRLQAEEDVGRYAKNQISLDSDRYLKFKNVVKWVDTAGKGAEGLYKIAKLIDPSIGSEKQIKGAKKNTDDVLKKLDSIIKTLDTKSNSGGGNNNQQQQQNNGGGNKNQHFSGRRKNKKKS